MTINKTLRYICLACLFLLPFAALIVSTSQFFPYITGKNFAFRALVEIMFVCWAALAFRDPSYRPRLKSPITISLVSFIVILFLADIFGEYFFKSFWSNFERMEGFITFIHLLALFFVSSLLLQSEKMWRRLFHTIFASSIIIGLMGIYQHFHGNVSRIDGTLGNSTYLGALMLFNIFLLLFYFMRVLRARSNNWKYNLGAYALAIIFDAYILVLTGTRGAFLGVLVGFIFIAIVFAFSKKDQKVIRYSGMGLLGLIILAFLLIISLQNTSLVKNNPSLSRLTAPVNAVLTLNVKKFADTEGEGRLLIWQAGLKGFEERPILGWGQENFNYVFNKYYTPAMYGQEQWFDRSHNVILDWLTQAGILGLLSYLSLFGFLIYSIWKKSNHGNDFSTEDKAILTGLLFAYFVHNFFVFDNITSYILFISVLAYVNWFKFESSDAPRKSWNIHPDIANYALSPIALIIALAALYFAVVQPYIASANLIKALGDEQNGNISATLSDYQAALSSHTFGDPEIREQLMTAIPYVVSSTNATTENKQQFVTFMQKEVLDQLQKTPHDARYFLFYGFSLDRLGDLVNAQKYLEEASKLSPGKQTILFELGLNYLAQGKNDEALKVLKGAYDSAPAYDEARVTYAVALIYSKNITAASQLVMNADSNVLGDNRLLKAYYDTKQYQSAIDIYHARQVASSTDPQNYLGAAGFYILLNDRISAISELVRLETVFKTLAAKDPNNTQYSQNITSVESFITQINAGKNPLPINS